MVGKASYFVTSDGIDFSLIGTKRDLYNWVARLVQKRRLIDPEYLFSRCIYNMDIMELYRICKFSGYIIVKMKSYSEVDLNGSDNR